jgi:ribosomal protein S28E/S33
MPLPKIVARAAGLAGEAGGSALKQLQHLRLPGVGPSSVTDDARTAARRWRVVTVRTDPDQLRTTTPAPLAAFGERLDVRVTSAPADKGAELAARFRGPVTEEDIGDLRAALRESKQLIEVGEVLRVDPQPHGHRPPTPQGAAIEAATREARKTGVL